MINIQLTQSGYNVGLSVYAACVVSEKLEPGTYLGAYSACVVSENEHEYRSVMIESVEAKP